MPTIRRRVKTRVKLHTPLPNRERAPIRDQVFMHADLKELPGWTPAIKKGKLSTREIPLWWNSTRISFVFIVNGKKYQINNCFMDLIA